MSTNEEIASHFAPYLKELHELFTMHGIQFGSPGDLAPIVDRLDRGGSFAEDVSSILRSIILREGGNVPQTELLEVVALAAAGPELDPTAPEIQPVFRRLLSFVGALVRRPWNEPPGRDLQADASDAVPAAPVSRGAAAVGSTAELGASWPEPDEAPVIAAFRPYARRHTVEEEEPAAAPEIPSATPVADRDPSRPLWVAAGCAALAVLLLIGFDRTHRSPAPSVAVVSPAASSAATTAPESVGEPASTEPPKPTAAMPLVHGRQSYGTYGQPRPPAKYSVQPASPPASSAAAPASSRELGPIETRDRPTASISPAPAPGPTAAPAARVEPAPAAAAPSSSSWENRRPAIALPRGRSGHGQYFQVSSGVMASHLVHATDPDYPMLARLAHVQGQVILQAVISTQGEVVAAHALSGHHLLRGAAAAAVRQWRYRPFLVDGRPVNVATIVSVEFHEHR